MEIRYMKRLNENGQEERFYPITHAKAIVGLSDVPEVSGNDLISTKAASEIVGDALEIDPAIVDLVNSLTAEDVEALPIQIITCAYGNTDEEIIKGLSENWNKLPNGIGSIQFSNGADIWYGTYYKYTDTIGSILMQNASGAYSKKFIRGNNTLIDLYTKDNKPTASDLSIPVNNNILINSNFANPVNQRGYVSGTDFMSAYAIDRWKGNGNLLFVENSHITLRPIIGTTSNTFIQMLEKPEQYTGKKLTLSVKCRTSTPEEQIQLFADGTANGSYSSLGYYAKHLSKANEWEVITQTFNINNETFSELKFGTNTGGTFDVEWAKLELGDHATPYVPRLYAEELTLCERRFHKVYVSLFPYEIGANYLMFRTHYKHFMQQTPTNTLNSYELFVNGELQTGFTCILNWNETTTQVIKCAKVNHGLTYSDVVNLWISFNVDAEL